MDQWKQQFWEDAFLAALEASKREVSFSSAEIEEIAKSLAISHENFSTYAGYDSIPNPKDDELVRIQKRLQKEIDDREKETRILRSKIAQDHGIRPEDAIVSIVNSSVIVEKFR
jgi:C-terminal processing protease CtpA/Prc